MTRSGENEGFRMLDDFVCNAIHAAGIPQADPTKTGKNEGMRIVAELAIEERGGSKAEDKRCGTNGNNSLPQRLSDFRLVDLVPETQEWNDGRGVDLHDWRWFVGSFEHAIGYGNLFWPEFTEFDDCVFFAEGFSKEAYYVCLRAGDNKREIEGVMNHRHILDLFSPPERQPTREQLVYLGRLLKEMWTAKLHRDFPTRRIVTSFFEEPCGDLVDYIITFFQEVPST